MKITAVRKDEYPEFDGRGRPRRRPRKYLEVWHALKLAPEGTVLKVEDMPIKDLRRLAESLRGATNRRDRTKYDWTVSYRLLKKGHVAILYLLKIRRERASVREFKHGPEKIRDLQVR